MIIDTNDVCACCDLFIPFGTCTLLTKIHSEFVSVIEAAVIVDDNLDCCRRTDNSSHFCNTYYVMIVNKQIPKFGSANYIHILLCQKDSNVFSDLTLVEKTFIACAHLIISVIKLRSNETDLIVSYY